MKEIFYSLQGEGARTGRPAVFCRFSGCNLWSGEEKHRAAADCNFCDTDFVGIDGEGGGKFKTTQSLAGRLGSFWPVNSVGVPYIVFTGGEPLLQLDRELIDAMHVLGFEIAVETNGTLAAPEGIDWLCVSPKGNRQLVQKTGNELKLVYPRTGTDPARFNGLDFDEFYLQPLAEQAGTASDINSDKIASQNIRMCTEYCLKNPQWKLSLQTHKYLGIP